MSTTLNCNLEEHHLGTKKLYLNNKGNSAFAKHISHFIESSIANIDIFGEIRVHMFQPSRFERETPVLSGCVPSSRLISRSLALR